MTDQATPNLPSRDFAVTSAFYLALGFTESWRDAHWMILERGSLKLEFFPYPDLDPYQSSFGACLRLDDADAFFSICKAAGIPIKNTDFPRLHPIKQEPWGGRVGALLDPDGTLIRLIQND
jgi:catechol 2,3-dioxygenase-like lactoylglutathione lyase family enzyme